MSVIEIILWSVLAVVVTISSTTLIMLFVVSFILPKVEEWWLGLRYGGRKTP